jgi:hypothetical protein
MDWNKVADHLEDAAYKYAEASDVAKNSGDKEAMVVFGVTGGLCSILACALWDGLAEHQPDEPCHGSEDTTCPSCGLGGSVS